ncbi:MAG: pilus assembly protein TadG-related protein [Terracidiphilus sp.]|jgi:hypothetical protein
MSFRKSESGNVLVLTALCMTILMGFVGLAIDVGMLFRARLQMQIAADAAAAAAALDYKYGESTKAQSDATAAATLNGMLPTGSATINDPPKSGYHQTAGYIEAVVSEPYPTFFMKVFHFNIVNVSARAVAGSASNGGCLWTLARSGTDVSLTGSGAITAQNCGIYDDSNASNALQVVGSGSITAKTIGIVGGYNNVGGHISPNPPTTGIAPAADPLSLPAPTIPTGSCSGSACNPSNVGSGNMVLGPGTYTSISNVGSGTLTLTPGNYIITGSLSNTSSTGGKLILGAGNYTIGGNFTSTTSSVSGSLTLGAGLYTVGGNLSLTGAGSMTGSGVTFYTQGSTTVTGSGGMNLSAPTSGTYSGVLFFQPSSDSHAMAITGSGGDDLQGIVYAPAAALTLTGSGNVTVSLDVIVDSMNITGTGTITLTNYAVIDNPNSVLDKLAMVE